MTISSYNNNSSLDELHRKLRKHLDDQSKNWKSFVYAQDKGFYQGFDEIKIDGWRNTEKRFTAYVIEKYLSKDKLALDIGSNCGFFTLFISRFVKHIDGIEINPYLVSVGNDTEEYLKINNATFHNSSFENFITEKKFDIIFSLANDETIDGNTKFTFKQYVDKILYLLKKDGILIFESQATDACDESRFLPKLEILKCHFDILENKKVKSEYPINVPERVFLVLKKII